jgi:hypothetical protein
LNKKEQTGDETMSKYSKRVLNHHKRNHNGRRRTRIDDTQSKPMRQPTKLVRSCGCKPENIPQRNQAILLALSECRPTYEWSALRGAWVPSMPGHLKAKFGRCLRHFDIEEMLEDAELVNRRAAAAA